MLSGANGEGVPPDGAREVSGMSPETCPLHRMGLNQAQRWEEEGVLQKQRERMNVEKEVRADGVSTRRKVVECVYYLCGKERHGPLTQNSPGGAFSH